MATDDREQQFERALAKHLKGAAEHACPDAEVLSAYHERTLSLEEMAKWKEHIAGCERCQDTLALVEQTESVDAEAWQEQNAALQMEGLAAKPEMVRTAAARIRWVAGSMVAAPAPAAPVELARRGSRAKWKWIVPIGAVAAGVIVWVGVAEIKHKQEADQAAQMAQNTQRAVPQPSLELKTLPPAAVEPNAARDRTAESRDDNKALSAASPPPPAPQASASPQIRAPRAAQERKQELDKKKDAVGEGHGYGNGISAKAPAAAPSAEGTDDFARNRGDVTALAKESGVVAGTAANAPVSRVTPAPKPPADKGRATAAYRSEAAPVNVSTITGTVLDPSGAAIGGALITAIDTSSGNLKTAVADAAGRFVLADLPSDQYRVVVAHAGFAQSEQTLTLAPQQNEQLRVQLKLGSATESVEVSAGAAPTLNTETAQLSTNAISREKVSQLPANGRNFQQLAQLAASDPRYIMAPDQKLAWRVGDAGKIERSTDHGKTWKLQNSGVGADLRAGSATSDRACWVIGKAGTILLTTDGGKHWRQVASPIAEDIGGIHASDAQHATIWNIPNRKSFQTSDGGATWTPAANQ
jgi:hypothetical protein